MKTNQTFLLIAISLSTLARAGSPTPEINLVLNAASLTKDLAPGAVALVFGTNFATDVAAGALVNGKTAQVLDANEVFWYIVIPNDAPAGAGAVQIGDSAPFDITLNRYAPALFRGPLTTPYTVRATRGTTPVTLTSPALPGDAITIFATGLGTADAGGRPAEAPTVAVNGQQVTVMDTLATTPGIYEVNIQLPWTLPSGYLPIVLSIGGFSSQPFTTLPVGALTGPSIIDVRNGASFLPGFSQGSWVTIFGANLAGTTRLWAAADFVGDALPTQLDNVSVTIDGKAAYVYYISPGQLNVLAPADTALTPVAVQVTYNGVVSNVMNITPAAVSPAMFMFDQRNRRYVAGVRLDGTYLGPPDLFQGAAVSVPAHAGDLIVLYGTGFGPTNPTTPIGTIVASRNPTANTITCTIGDVPATVQFAGLVAAGEYQFNIIVPNVAAGDRLVVLSVNGVQSQPNAYLAVQ